MQPNVDNIGSIIPWAIQVLVILASVLFMFMFLTGGIAWMVSGGNKEKVDAAKARLKNAFIGLILVLCSWAIAGFIGNVFGVNLLTFNLPSI